MTDFPSASVCTAIMQRIRSEACLLSEFRFGRLLDCDQLVVGGHFENIREMIGTTKVLRWSNEMVLTYSASWCDFH